MTRSVIVNDPNWQACIDMFIAAQFDISGSAATVEGGDHSKTGAN